MTTQCVDLDIVGGGVGAPSNVSALAAKKTIVVSGVTGSINIEAGIGGEFCVVKTFGTPVTDDTFEVVCDEVRVDATNGNASSVQIAGERAASRFIEVPAPGGGGIGDPINVKELGEINSAIADDPDGSLVLEISQDPADPPDPNSFSQVFKNFTVSNKCQTECFSACWARSRAISGSGSAIQLGAQESAVGGAAGALSGSTVIWRPGAEGEDAPGGNVFPDFFDALAAAQSLEPYGEVDFVVDGRFGFPFVPPGDEPFHDLSFAQIRATQSSDFTPMLIGTTARLMCGNWSSGCSTFLIFYNGTDNVGTFEAALISPFGFHHINDGEVIFTSGSTPFGPLPGTGPVIGPVEWDDEADEFVNSGFIGVRNRSGARAFIGNLGGEPALSPAIDLDDGALALLDLGCNGFLGNNAITDSNPHVNTTAICFWRGFQNSGPASFADRDGNYDFPGLPAGAFFARADDGAAPWRYTVVGAGTVDIDTCNHLVLHATELGPETVNLLDIGEGGTGWCKIKNTGDDGNDLTVAPRAGWTIDGAATPVVLKDGCGIELVYDQNKNWVTTALTFAESPAYNPTNVTTDRDFDADAAFDAAGFAVLSDVVGTLIADLQDRKILG